MEGVCVPYVRAARSRGLLLGLLVGGLLVCGVLALLLCCGVMPWHRTVTLYLTDALARTRGLHPQPHRAPIRLQAPARPDTLTLGDGKNFLMVPAVYSAPDEGYVIRMRLGVDNVLVVLDSGSGHLSVGTADCVKASLCSAHDGAYRPEASPSALSLGDAPATLQYASLAVQAQWWQDAAALPFVSLSACHKAPPALEDVTDEAPLAALLPVAAATRMDGTASNILGLMGDHPSQSSAPVLEHMLTALGVPRRWSLAAYPDGAGWFTLGAFPQHCFPRVTLKHVPASPTFSYMGAPCVDIAGVRWRVGGKGAPWQSAAPGTFPAHAVLDTGTADSYCVRAASGFAAAAGLPADTATLSDAEVDALPDIEVQLAGGLAVVYGPRHYMVPAGGQSQGYRTTLHCGEDKVESLFAAGARVFLIGIHHLAGWLLDVDLDRGRIGFGRLPDPS